MLAKILRQNIISLWLEFHFFDAPRNILLAWKNFLKFNLNYFSIPTLIKTFFWPWHRYRTSYGKRIDPWHYFETFVFNSMSRIIGALLRLFFISLGLLVEVFIVFAGLTVFLGWLVLPLILLLGFLFGARMLV